MISQMVLALNNQDFKVAIKCFDDVVLKSNSLENKFEAKKLCQEQLVLQLAEVIHILIIHVNKFYV